MKELNIPLDYVKKHQYWSGKSSPAIMIKRNGWNAFLNEAKDYYDENSGNQNQPKNSIMNIATMKMDINSI
ncbi:hypothetical protein [Bacillus arachidis]|uniref:hypothetical protein n=1 Tax=Bacillus arachidis TaxID=2819290 RepID=UPI00255C75BC|nr:hypothetical protein [Bacillus arachidis]WIY63726.1 hypothetical protein QRY57_25730 [Bacillus arachidis]